MKNQELFTLHEELKTLNLSGKIGYAIAKNRRLIEQEVATLQETAKASEDFNEYEKARLALLEIHAKKDDKGKSIIEDNAYVLNDKEAWDKAFEEIKKEHKDAIDKRVKQLQEYQDLLNEESKLELFKVKEEEIPETATSQEVYILLKLT